MTISVDDVCTDADLKARAGSERLDRAMSSTSQRDSARAVALREVVLALQGRAPAIAESDLSDPTEMRDVVCTRALAIIFEQCMTTGDGVYALLAAQYGREYAAMSKRSYSVSGGLRGPSGGSFRIERR